MHKWIGLALVTAGGSCAVAADAGPSCPAGQIGVTRIDYEGKYNLSPMVDMFNLQALASNVGYTRRTVLVGTGGYYKEASEGTILVVKESAPGTPIPLHDSTLYARQLPSRFVIMETPQQKFVYDEKGDPENLGTRRTKSKQFSAAEERVMVDALQTALAPHADRTKILGKATYAGIECEVRQYLVPGNSVCVASIRGQYVTLAEEHQSPTRPEPSRMQAKTKADVCVSLKEFEPPADVRFK